MAHKLKIKIKKTLNVVSSEIIKHFHNTKTGKTLSQYDKESAISFIKYMAESLSNSKCSLPTGQFQGQL